MQHKRPKYNGCKAHEQAILHMIGQSQSVFKEYVTIRDVAGWMNVSKPTARKYLARLLNDYKIYMWTRPYKSGDIWMISLSDSHLSEYLNGEYKAAYHAYAQRVMGVILEDD